MSNKTTKTCPRCKSRPIGSTSSGKDLDYCKQCQSERTTEKHQAFKAECVKHKGGKCTKCGYSHYQGALCLPVREDLRKSKTYIKMGSLAGRLPLTDKVKSELAQRELLCMNCYRASLSNKDNSVKASLCSAKGNTCSICNKVYRPIAMDFHHVDGTGAPSKTLTIGSRTAKRDLPALTQEVSKCVLVCANCHCEHHEEERAAKKEKTN